MWLDERHRECGDVVSNRSTDGHVIFQKPHPCYELHAIDTGEYA